MFGAVFVEWPTATASRDEVGRQMSQIHRRQFGERYEVLGELGVSAGRSVWHGRDGRTGADVAIKLLRPELFADPAALGELRATLEAVARLEHPGILAVDDLVVHDNQVALVSRFVPGGSLRNRLARRGPLPLDRSVGMMAGVCRALGAAHAIGVVHGALTPSQIRLEPLRPAPDEALLDDFGMAALIDRAAATGLLPFVPAAAQYEAPEIAAGQPRSAAADVHAVGVLLYETLTGHRPFHEPPHDGADSEQRPPAASPPVAGLPAAVWQTIMTCLAPDPGQRPSADQLAALLVGFGSPVSLPAQRPVPGAEVARTRVTTATTTVIALPRRPSPQEDATVFMPVIRPDTPPPAVPGQRGETAEENGSGEQHRALVSGRRLVQAAVGATVLAIAAVGFTTLSTNNQGTVNGTDIPVLAVPGGSTSAAGGAAAPGSASAHSSPKSTKSPSASASASGKPSSTSTSSGAASASASPASNASASAGAPTPSLITNAGNTSTGTSLQNAYSGSCLDTSGAYANGVAEQILACSGSTAESWTTTSAGTLTQDGGQYCLDDYALGTTPGTRVVLWACNGGANQRWTIRANGEIFSVNAGLCLDIVGPSKTDGAQIQLSTCTDQASQQWTWK
jgi:serine/threonine protein kinase